MKTLQIQNGDILLDSGGKLQFIQGTSKLVQDLTLWLKEPLGVGYTTPNFGSTLTSMIGGTIGTATIVQVQAEVQRILNLYQSQQILSLKTAQNLSQLGNWNKSEIINSINSVQASQSYNSIVVNVIMTSLSNTQLSIALFINSNGVRIQANG